MNPFMGDEIRGGAFVLVTIKTKLGLVTMCGLVQEVGATGFSFLCLKDGRCADAFRGKIFRCNAPERTVVLSDAFVFEESLLELVSEARKRNELLEAKNRKERQEKRRLRREWEERNKQHAAAVLAAKQKLTPEEQRLLGVQR